MHRYTFTALIEIPAHGKYAAGGRADLNGEITSEAPMREADIKHAIAFKKADQRGCDANGITFLDFTCTELPVA